MKRTRAKTQTLAAMMISKCKRLRLLIILKLRTAKIKKASSHQWFKVKSYKIRLVQSKQTVKQGLMQGLNRIKILRRLKQ